MVKALVAKAQERGVDLCLGAAVKRIVRVNSRVTGVTIEDRSGNTKDVRDKAVMIADGGYVSNKEMIKQYTGFDLGRTTFERIS